MNNPAPLVRSALSPSPAAFRTPSCHLLDQGDDPGSARLTRPALVDEHLYPPLCPEPAGVPTRFGRWRPSAGRQGS